jgi:DNA-directed RNA polymerase subunit RPC12/RpoP
MAIQPICKGCGRPIVGYALNALNATWHPEHFVCAVCHLPIHDDRFNVHQGQPYHSSCFVASVLPRCVFCGKPLVGEYLVDQWGTRYCKEHQGKYPNCIYCGRLVPPNMRDLSDKHDAIRCPICRKSAIETDVEAQPLFRRIIQWVGTQGLRYNNLHLSLELCDRNKLASYLRERSHMHALGATVSSTYKEQGRVVRTEIDTIAVLQGLPTTLFQGVVVHELGHVWLAVHGIQKLPAWAEEGFCELLSYRYYSGMASNEGSYHNERILRNSDPVYGEGFRRIRAMADRLGFERFVDILRTTKRLPAYL